MDAMVSSAQAPTSGWGARSLRHSSCSHLKHPDPGCAPLQRLWVLWGALALKPSGIDLCPAINLRWKTDALA